jgi:C4-type Zn-finger protein
MFCGSNKAPTLKQPLSTVNFPELVFSIKNSKLKFDNIEGVFKQIANEDPNYRRNNSEESKVRDEEEALKKEIAHKKEKIKYIKDKLLEMDKKQEMMVKILNVDINEREYIHDLKNKC